MVTKCIDDLHDSYLIMNQENQGIIGYQYQMMRKFNIPNLLSIATYQEGEHYLIYYLISHKDTLLYCLKEKTFMFSLLKKLVMSLLTVFEQLQQYLLDESQLDLNPEYIYYDRIQNEFYFLFLPCTETKKGIKEQVFGLFDLLIQRINTNDYKAVSLIHRLRIAVENDRFNIKEIEMIVEQIENLEGKDENRKIITTGKEKSLWLSWLFDKKDV